MRIPHADKRRGAPPGDACGIVVAPMALVASCGRGIPAYQGAQVATVWVGTSRPASWACRGATAAGNAMTKQGARVARRRDCAAFGYVVNRATSDRVQPLRFFILVGGREGCRPRRRAVSLAVRLSWLSQKEFLKIGGRRGRWATARSCPRAAPGMFCSGRGGQGRNPEGAVPRLALGAAALSMPGTGHRARRRYLVLAGSGRSA